MGIWFVSSLNDEGARRSGYREATLQAWAAGGWACTVLGRTLLEQPIAVAADNAAEFMAAMEICSVAFGGAVEMRPAAPWAGFTVAPALGLAMLECLVEHVPRQSERHDGDRHAWSAVERCRMTMHLFSLCPEVRQVASPLSCAEGIALMRPQELSETTSAGRFQVTRLVAPRSSPKTRSHPGSS